MKESIRKILHSEWYLTLRAFITMDGDKIFIISSLTYYIVISLIPFITLSTVFMKLFHLEVSFFPEALLEVVPELEEISSGALYFDSTLIGILTNGVSVYIASKGTMNYYRYLQQKYRLPAPPGETFLGRIYVCALTVLLCMIFALAYALVAYIDSFGKWLFHFLAAVAGSLLTFGSILLLNYFLTRRRIRLRFLIPGSFFSTCLLCFSNIAMSVYLYGAESKTRYYGLLTSTVVGMLFLYLLVYFFALGNQMNYMLYCRNCERKDG